MRTQIPGDAFLIIDDAIVNQQVIQIRLNKRWRTVEPYMTGLEKNTLKSVVYSYCRDVIPSFICPSRWQTFNLDEIDAIDVTNYSFQPHVDYDGQDDCMLTVYRKLKPIGSCEESVELSVIDEI